MLPESLQNILDSTDYLEYEIDILKLDVSTNPLKMEFLMSDTEGSIDKTIISMNALGTKDFYIDKESGSSYLHLEHDHPLLWRFTDIQCELYISGGRPKQIEKIVFDLLQIHNSFFDQYQAFDLQLLNVLTSGHGLLKKGPKKILTEFAESINKNGIKASIISELHPNDKNQHLAVLFLGHSYVIAEKFDFEITK